MVSTGRSHPLALLGVQDSGQNEPAEHLRQVVWGNSRASGEIHGTNRFAPVGLDINTAPEIDHVELTISVLAEF